MSLSLHIHGEKSAPNPVFPKYPEWIILPDISFCLSGRVLLWQFLTFYRQVNIWNGLSTLQVSKLTSNLQFHQDIQPSSRKNSDPVKRKLHHFIPELQKVIRDLQEIQTG